MKIIPYVIIISLFGIFPLSHAKNERSAIKNSTLFGSLYSPKGIHYLAGLPIVYKGCEYEIMVQSDADTKKADFELYDDEKPTQLHIIITEYLKTPSENNVEHLQTSPDHSYRIFRLTRYSLIETDIQSQDFNSIKPRPLTDLKDSWDIEELDNSKSGITIPDNALILFMPVELVDRLETVVWLSNNTSVKLPIIILKDTLTLATLRDVSAKMKLAFLDFKFLHKKPLKAFVPYTNNHILSMPFTPRGYNC